MRGGKQKNGGKTRKKEKTNQCMSEKREVKRNGWREEFKNGGKRRKDAN